MRVCAVICEYNPFHLGHAYHLRAAREASGADYVLGMISGSAHARRWKTARMSCSNCRLASPVPPRRISRAAASRCWPPSAW